MPAKKYSDGQIRAAIEFNENGFVRLVDDFLTDKIDYKLARHVDRLLLQLYYAHASGRKLKKTEACKFIPANQASTCIKYVERAKAEGFLKFEKDTSDRRVQFVIISDDLVDYFEQRITEYLDEMRSILDQVAKVSPLPDDNLPLHGYDANSSKSAM